jgi:ComF family protein
MFDWLWAPQCAACSRPIDAAPLCDPCGGTLVPADERRAPLPLDRVIAPWQFGGELATAIRRYKFTGATQVARALVPLWSSIVAAAADALDEPLVVPVPTHWRRRMQRGFDHTWLLARHVCRATDLPRPASALARLRAVPPQSTLSAAERTENLIGAFVARSADLVRDRDVVLLDDVVTTGATMAACADALAQAGARRIIGIALARTER